MRKTLVVLLVGIVFFFGVNSAIAEWSPLPADLNIVKPGEDVPPEIAAFSGLWAGTWKNPPGSRMGDKPPNVQVAVERIHPPLVIVTYSWGANRVSPGGYVRRKGQIDGNCIVFQPSSGATVKLVMVGGEIHATWVGSGPPLTAILYRER